MTGYAPKFVQAAAAKSSQGGETSLHSPKQTEAGGSKPSAISGKLLTSKYHFTLGEESSTKTLTESPRNHP
jgi:hypothetical protein